MLVQPSLPGKTDNLTLSLWEKCYRSATLTTRAINTDAMLAAHMVACLVEGIPTSDTLEELRSAADWILHCNVVAQVSGRTMSLAVVGARGL